MLLGTSRQRREDEARLADRMRTGVGTLDEPAVRRARAIARAQAKYGVQLISMGESVKMLHGIGVDAQPVQMRTELFCSARRNRQMWARYESDPDVLVPLFDQTPAPAPEPAGSAPRRMRSGRFDAAEPDRTEPLVAPVTSW